jgi:hypothetical protein
MPKATRPKPKAKGNRGQGKGKQQPSEAKKRSADGLLPPIRITIDSNLFVGEDISLARSQKQALELFGCRKKGEAGRGLC